MKITKRLIEEMVREELDDLWSQRSGTEREGQPLDKLEQLKMALKHVDPGTSAAIVAALKELGLDVGAARGPTAEGDEPEMSDRERWLRKYPRHAGSLRSKEDAEIEARIAADRRGAAPIAPVPE